MSRFSPTIRDVADPHRVLQQIHELTAKFVPRCIAPGEDRDKAMFYAGQAELSRRIQALINGED